MATITLNGSASGSINLTVPAAAGTNTVTIPASTGTLMIASNSYSWPANYGTNGQVLTTDGAGNLSWATGGGGGSGTVNAGTTGQLAYYAAAGTAVSGLSLGTGWSTALATNLGTGWSTALGAALGTGVGTVLGNATNAANGIMVANGSGVLAVAQGGTGISSTGAGTIIVSATANTISGTATPTLGVPGTTAGTLSLSGLTSGTITLAVPAISGTNTVTLPAQTGTLLVSVPGAVQFFAMNTAPTGWLECNGASLSTATYADLFAAIGYTFGGAGASFTLPDLRGQFIRGWDNGAGVDAGRAFGSTQADDFASHTHSYNGFWGGNWIMYQNGGNGIGATISTGGAGGTETRPKNIALLPCIKY
jgi:hypothetical protein